MEPEVQERQMLNAARTISNIMDRTNGNQNNANRIERLIIVFFFKFYIPNKLNESKFKDILGL